MWITSDYYNQHLQTNVWQRKEAPGGTGSSLMYVHHTPAASEQLTATRVRTADNRTTGESSPGSRVMHGAPAHVHTLTDFLSLCRASPQSRISPAHS